MFNLFHLFLYLHVLGMIIAFGPTWAFPIIGGLSSREPQHGNFALRLSLTLEDRLVIPLGLSLAVTGVGLIVTVSPSISITEPWLLAGIGLYLISFVLALGVMRTNLIKLVRLTSQPPPMPAGVMPSGVGAGGAPAGPPPAVLARLNLQARLGMVLTVLFLLVVLLMVFQPGGASA
jgi:hypothetical protein